MMLPARYYADLLGRGFRDGGRGPEFYDCWGLLQIVQRRLGRRPTDFPSDPLALSRALADEWAPVPALDALPGDGILMASVDPRWSWHVGVVVSPCRMLHVREVAGVVVERFDAPGFSRRIAGFYRFQGQTA